MCWPYSLDLCNSRMATAAIGSHPLRLKAQEKDILFPGALNLSLKINLIAVSWILSPPVYKSLRPGELTVLISLNLGHNVCSISVDRKWNPTQRGGSLLLNHQHLPEIKKWLLEDQNKCMSTLTVIN